MTDQEIVDAIDAEIAEVKVSTPLCFGDFYWVCMSRIEGLSFARALIVKRIEAST